MYHRVQIIAFVLSLFTPLAFADNPNTRFIFELYHHGSRSSLYMNYNVSDVPWHKNHTHGELTNVGLRQAYLMGRVLRE